MKNELVKVNETFTPVTVEIEGVRYLTTEQLADGYGADVDNIKKNYSNNAGRFKEGKHYIVLKGEALKELRVNMVHLQISSMTRSLYLWTKQGASRHSKMLGTDKAWDVFDALEENYFNPKQQWQVPTTREGLLELALEQERKIATQSQLLDEQSKKIEHLYQGNVLLDVGKKTLQRALKNKVAALTGKKIDKDSPEYKAMKQSLFYRSNITRWEQVQKRNFTTVMNDIKAINCVVLGWK